MYRHILDLTLVWGFQWLLQFIPPDCEFVSFADWCVHMWRDSTYLYGKWRCWFIQFSIDGVVKQGMSGNRQFQTTALKKGQVVKVRTRYAITFDGNVTETAWKRCYGRQYLFCLYLRMHPTDILIPLKSVNREISWFWYCRKNRE
jgi:hypothetical protein